MRVGVFGGTFDPIHMAHLVAAVNARHVAELDSVLFVVANMPWQKVGTRPLSAATDRLALVEAALNGREGLKASDLELRRGGPSYTADTLKELSRLRRNDSFFLIVGADVAGELSTWERVEEVYDLATLVVVNRPGIPQPEISEQWRVIYASIPALDVSSTDLRERVAQGRPLDFLIPDAAIRCIAQRSLYAGREPSYKESSRQVDDLNG